MSVVVTNRRSLGVNFSSRGESEVLVWAPHAKSVAIVSDDKDARITLHPEARGYFSCITSHLRPGDRYWVELDQQIRLPDPASMLQPAGIFGPSEVFNPNNFHWSDREWTNPPLREYIIYELHVGTFTSRGDFLSIIDRLPYLNELGITAIELMPVSEFPGDRNWGYDGVFPYAAHHAYGGPRALQELVDACHQHKIAVILDVVYNHLGPEGNNLGKFGPYFTEKYNTPWGKAINFDDHGCDEVRKYFLENALMWLRDFHIDALRLDAVHAIRDFGATHFLEELAADVKALNADTNSTHYLIAECDLNDPKFLRDLSRDGYGMQAQWIDEFHHALRVAAGKRPIGYYSDFDGMVYLSKAFADAYVYDGQYSLHRQKTFGRKVGNISGDHFVVFSQNHDQVGNTMLGDRSSHEVSFGMLKVLAGAVLCSPYIPLLFMGEEYGERQPFQYFVSHHGDELVEAVRTGRRNEFLAFFTDGGHPPDPQANDTFLNSKLRWDRVSEPGHEALLRYYKELIRLRKASIVLASCSRDELTAVAYETEKCLYVQRNVSGHHMVAVFNFSPAEQRVSLPDVPGMSCLLNASSSRWGGNEKSDPEYNALMTLSPTTFLLFGTEHV
jgi:maltooligosyltrehalose trehalohydrolase